MNSTTDLAEKKNLKLFLMVETGTNSTGIAICFIADIKRGPNNLSPPHFIDSWQTQCISVFDLLHPYFSKLINLLYKEKKRGNYHIYQ